MLEGLYAKRKNLDLLSIDKYGMSHFSTKGKYEKYYGGHQFRLGHYFRHLYQTYKFVDSSEFLSKEQKSITGKCYELNFLLMSKRFCL